MTQNFSPGTGIGGARKGRVGSKEPRFIAGLVALITNASICGRLRLASDRSGNQAWASEDQVRNL